MSNLKKGFIWFLISGKRLLHKWAFVVILCIIPVIMPITEIAMQQESNIMKIGICAVDDSSETKDIVDHFTKKDGIIKYIAYDDEQSAKKAVEKFEIDVAWIFIDNYKQNIAGFVKSEKDKEPKSVVVYQREDSVIHKLSREVLLGAVYGDMSYEVYKDFVSTELVKDRELTQEEIDYYYENLDWNEDGEKSIINLRTLDESKTNNKANYLTSPLRGLLSLLILLCSLTAAVYYLKDKADKKYDWLPSSKRIIPAFSLCLCAACFSALITLVSLLTSGISTNVIIEIMSMIMYVMCVTAFCVVLCTIIDSYGVLGALIPGIMIVSLVVSPIFFSFDFLKLITMILPTNYYLKSIYNASYYLNGFVYCICAFTIAYLINTLKNKN